jgi:hypothetical protein
MLSHAPFQLFFAKLEEEYIFFTYGCVEGSKIQFSQSLVLKECPLLDRCEECWRKVDPSISLSIYGNRGI